MGSGLIDVDRFLGLAEQIARIVNSAADRETVYAVLFQGSMNMRLLLSGTGLPYDWAEQADVSHEEQIEAFTAAVQYKAAQLRLIQGAVQP